jgi:hypothetical protein
VVVPGDRLYVLARRDGLSRVLARCESPQGQDGIPDG